MNHYNFVTFGNKLDKKSRSASSGQVICMDDRVKMHENGTLYIDYAEQEQPEEIFEIESSGLLYYLFLIAAIGIVGIITILALLFFGFLLILLIPILLVFGILLLWAFFRRLISRNP